MNLTAQYIQQSRALLDTIEAQTEAIQQAATWFSQTILAGRMVHLFGSGHSRIMVEEMWPRYGSFPGFNPIVELSLTFHNLVVGANGQRKAISSSGCNVVPIEMAELFQRQGVKVVALITKRHADKSTSKRSDGKKLSDFADLILDTGAPVGDAMITVPGLDTPVAPGATVGGAVLVNCIKAEVARLLTEAGQSPKVLSAANVVGSERAITLFESAYDEHAHRLAKRYQTVGIPSYISEQTNTLIPLQLL